MRDGGVWVYDQMLMHFRQTGFYGCFNVIVVVACRWGGGVGCVAKRTPAVDSLCSVGDCHADIGFRVEFGVAVCE